MIAALLVVSGAWRRLLLGIPTASLWVRRQQRLQLQPWQLQRWRSIRAGHLLRLPGLATWVALLLWQW